MSHERDSNTSQSDRHFVDPVAEYLEATCSNGEPSSYGRVALLRPRPPWYLFQYFCCLKCSSASSSHVSNSPVASPNGDPTRANLLSASISDDSEDQAALNGANMRSAARLAMLITAFFVAIAQWAALASGVKYFEDLVGLSEGDASSASSGAFAVCFLSSIAGGVLGDSLWGNIKTLFIGLSGALLSSTALAIVSFPSLDIVGTGVGQVLMALGLFVFALSVGLCQTAIPNLVGDQCHHDPQRLQRYYNIYYGVIQFGAFLSRIFFPILHNHIDWFVAIGVCMTVPIALALLIFTMNASILSFRRPSDQLHAWRAFLITARKWLLCAPKDELEVRYGEDDVADAAKGSAVLLLHAPLPIFWGLYFQMFELWYLQAKHLNLNLFAGKQIDAEQATALNPIFDVILLLGFSYFFTFLKQRFDKEPRNTIKILLGYLAATAAYAYAIGLQVIVVDAAEGTVSVWTQAPQYVLLCAAEVLVYPAALHEVYLRSPPTIRSFVQSCLWFFIGIGNAMNVIVLAADANLDSSSGSGSNGRSETLTPLFIGYAVAMLGATLLYTALMVMYHRGADVETRSSRGHSTVEVSTAGKHEGDIVDSSTSTFIADGYNSSNQVDHLGLPRRETDASGVSQSAPRRIPISPRTQNGTLYHSSRKSPRASALTSGEYQGRPN
ncbi:proton-dependent oligopeptide transporter, putative [Bodo saltans]|uniref:Proton-dependent oligopeptide transporter, putative n=1 Tax=Bodo saltans TaxID=75058 RepID=A0A0S4JV47_BODSA|nr:proton-dependent oligopeptide transporter, putative [Bodo saltans]|eukprot:CUG92988.1 proton-dependent oligopeptide transporter, putative [Bodo saltans]